MPSRKDKKYKIQINIKFRNFSCHPGWTGVNCDQCVTLPGCSYYGYCTKPMECLCKYGYEGHFCNTPTCRDGCNATTGKNKTFIFLRIKCGSLRGSKNLENANKCLKLVYIYSRVVSILQKLRYLKAQVKWSNNMLRGMFIPNFKLLTAASKRQENHVICRRT